MPNTKQTPPVGPATVAGLTTSLTAAVAAVLAYLFADADDQTLGVIAAGVVALVSLVTTQLGRYAQAAKRSAPAPAPYVFASGSSAPQQVTLTSHSDPAADVLRDPPDDGLELDDNGDDGPPEHEQRDLHENEQS